MGKSICAGCVFWKRMEIETYRGKSYTFYCAKYNTTTLSVRKVKCEKFKSAGKEQNLANSAKTCKDKEAEK